MPDDDYLITPDPDALRRENELLALENTYLKGRLGGLEEELRRLRGEREAPGVPAPEQPNPGAQT